jgi:hypothetical protein
VASPNSRELNLSGVVWMGRNPLVQLCFPHSREGGDMSVSPQCDLVTLDGSEAVGIQEVLGVLLRSGSTRIA